MKRLIPITFCRLLESSGDVWKVIVIEEGLSKNGKYYSKEALEQAVPLFEDSKVCFYEWDKGKNFNHVPPALEQMRPEGFPLQTAGVLKDAKFETIEVEGREVSGITAKMHLFATSKISQLKQLLVSAWQKGMKNVLGLSINAEGSQSMRMLNGVPMQFVDSIKRVLSTDLVTHPAAGGGLVKIIASTNNKEEENVKMFKKIIEALKKLTPKLFEGIDAANITQEELVGVLASLDKAHKHSAVVESTIALIKSDKLDEAAGAIEAVIKEEDDASGAAKKAEDDAAAKKAADEDAAKKAADEDAAAGAKAAEDDFAKATEARFAAFEKKQELRECKETLRDVLNESGLPAPFKDKIKKTFADRIFKESDLRSVIKEERSALSKLAESDASIDLGDLGYGHFEMREPVDRMQASLDLMVGYVPEADEKDDYKGVQAFKGLREAYVAYTDDPTISGVLGPAAVSRLQEAAATSNSFTYALGYTINRKMVKEYATKPQTWRKIAVTTNVRDFKMQERIRWGGFGEIPTVQAARSTQGTPVDSASISYTELGFPADEEATYAILTKGGKVTLTRRMIINDDLKILTGIPKRLASAADFTLNQYVFDLMLGMSSGTINGATMYDSVALYATGHRNYRTGALGYDNLKLLLDDMWFQVETGATTTANETLAAADTTFTVTDGTKFRAGDKIVCNGEIMRVTSISSNDLTVVRGQYGTTDAEQATGSTVYQVSKFIEITKPLLWAPRSIHATADTLAQSQMNPEQAEDAVNTIRNQFDLQPPCPYLQGDENNYFLSAPTDQIEGIEIGFLNGKENPEIFIQDNPSVGTVFTADTITYKLRHEYGGAVIDYRAFAASIVA